MSKPTSVRFDDDLMLAIESQQAREQRGSRHEMIRLLVERGLEMSDMLPFNTAMTLIKMYHCRDEFHAWCKAKDVPMYNTLGEWENYARAFETDGAADDERNTQADALR